MLSMIKLVRQCWINHLKDKTEFDQHIISIRQLVRQCCTNHSKDKRTFEEKIKARANWLGISSHPKGFPWRRNVSVHCNIHSAPVIGTHKLLQCHWLELDLCSVLHLNSHKWRTTNWSENESKGKEPQIRNQTNENKKSSLACLRWGYHQKEKA